MSIPFRLLRPGMLAVSVHDVAGRVVSWSAAEPVGAGDQTIAWEIGGFAGGLYWVRLSLDGRAIAKQRFTVLR